MKRSTKRIAMMMAGSLLLGGTGAALASGGHFGKGGCDHHGGPMAALSQVDNLSDEQRNQIKAVFQEQRQSMREQKERMRESRQALRDAMHGGADKEELKALAEKQGDQITAMIMARAQMRDKVHAILSEEQRAELQKMQQERMKERYDDHDSERGRW